MKNRMIFGVILFLTPICFGIWMQTNAIKEGKNLFQSFNSAVIDNRIESVRIAYKGTGMKLDDGRYFVFYPYTDTMLNDGNKFNLSAEEGDRIKKGAFSDTLYLYKGDSVLAYTFKKF